MKAIKCNMSDQILTDDRKILHCSVCDTEYSGHSGDYFTYPDDHIFTCCAIEMELVEKVITINYI